MTRRRIFIQGLAGFVLAFGLLTPPLAPAQSPAAGSTVLITGETGIVLQNFGAVPSLFLEGGFALRAFLGKVVLHFIGGAGGAGLRIQR